MSAAAPDPDARGSVFDAPLIGRLEALAERHYHHRHPFNALMHAGRLERGDLRLWAANRYYYQTRIPLKDALIIAKSEDQGFRRLWIQRLLDHDGRGDPREPGSGAGQPGGLELWRRLGAALGLERADLESGVHLLPAVRAACDEYVEAVRAADLVTAVAFSLTEFFASRLMQVRIEAWLQHYSFVEERALEYFRQRVGRARGDAESALAFVLENATSTEVEERCLQAFTHKCRILWRLLDAVYLARRAPRRPRLESRTWLMRVSALAQDDASGGRAAPGVLMVPERALQLNRTAHDLLERCDGRRSLARIVDELAQQHAAPVETVESDVATFVAELEQRRILTFDGGAEP